MVKLSEPTSKILFLNTGGNHNLGDRSMLLNVVRLVRGKLPNAELMVDAGVPLWMINEFRLTPVATMVNCWGRGGETLKALYAFIVVILMRLLLMTRGYHFLPRQCMEFELLSAIDRCDMIWMVGGGYLNDLGAVEARGVLATAWLGQQSGRPVAMTGQGLGPFTSSMTKRLFRAVALKSKSIILREPTAGVKELRALGDSKILWSPGVDDACSLPATLNDLAGPACLALHFRRSTFHAHGGYLERDFLQLMQCLIERGEKVKLFVFSERKSYELAVYEEWIRCLGDTDAVTIVQDSDPRKLLAELRTCRCAIGMAYHFHLFALLSGIPSLAMCSGEYYESKYEGIDTLFGQSRSFVNYLDVNEKMIGDFVASNNPSKSCGIDYLKSRSSILRASADTQILNTLDIMTGKMV